MGQKLRSNLQGSHTNNMLATAAQYFPFEVIHANKATDGSNQNDVNESHQNDADGSFMICNDNSLKSLTSKRRKGYRLSKKFPTHQKPDIKQNEEAPKKKKKRGPKKKKKKKKKK